MSQEYRLAPEVEEIANDLIHHHHSHLAGAQIIYVFLGEAPKSKGKEQMGRARVMTGLNAWLATDPALRESEPDPFFLVEIAKRYWDVMNEKQRRALVDHELHHLDVDEEGKLITRPHDVEEFSGVIRRHGLWWHDIEAFAEVVDKVKQRSLFGRESRDEAARESHIESVTISAEGEEPVTMTGAAFTKAVKQIGNSA